MAKVLTVSRQFPAYHPRKGEPTYFVEKIWNAFHVDALGERFFMPFEDDFYGLNKDVPFDVYMAFRDTLIVSRTQKFEPKYHTIRAGKRWKTGDMVSLRAWSGKPYNSKQIIIAPDFALPKVHDVKMYYSEKWGGSLTIAIGPYEIEYPYGCKEWLSFSKNDGLELLDMKHWFELAPDFKKTKQFDGQMIFFTDTPTPY